VFALLLNISFNGFAADIAYGREEIGRRAQHRQSSQMGKFPSGPIIAESQEERKAHHSHVAELPEKSAPEE
jgi:hypothetical protein